MVVFRLAGRDSYDESAGLNFVSTRWSANAGMYFSIGSSRRNFPSSQSIMTAVAVIALVCEAMRKMSSSRCGALVPRSRDPYAL